MSDDGGAPRVPSGYQLERAMSAWEQLRQLYASDPELIEDEQVLSATLAEADAAQAPILLDRTIDALVWIERREAEADELRKEIVARRDRYRERAAQVRALIEQLMSGLEMTKREAKLATASVRDGQPSLVVTDEELIPAEYFKVERTLMRQPLKEDLEQGVVVPGAVMSNPAPVLAIKRKR
jgi:type I site-specific restriction endonuclease